MESFLLSDVIKAVDGKILYQFEDTRIIHVTTNSREVKKGSLFVPIVGNRCDAHDFIAAAFKNGAVACFTERDNLDFNNKNLIKVENTCSALQNLASWYRSKITNPIISVTGSVGKTSTKEMLAAAFSAKHNVLKTFGNQNSQIGVPLTIFNIEKKHDFSIVEMGISEFDEMEKISKVAKANYSVITNIGISHIENLGTQNNILLEKLHSADYIGKNGKLFLNGDDPLLFSYYDSANDNRYILFGTSPHCHYMAKNILSNKHSTEFELVYPGGSTMVLLPTIGKHNVINATAAISVAHCLGLDLQEIKQGISEYETPKMRQKIHKKNNLTIIDDSYNASPDSIKSGIEVLNKTKKNRTIMVIADMLELGKLSEQEHFKIGLHIAENEIDFAVCIGNYSKYISKGIEEKNICTSIKIAENNFEAYEYLRKILQPYDTILVKGSRGMKTDEIVNNLLNL